MRSDRLLRVIGFTLKISLEQAALSIRPQMSRVRMCGTMDNAGSR
jgi:hypothetical protein